MNKNKKKKCSPLSPRRRDWWMMNKNSECCTYLGNCFKSEIATTNDHPSVFVRISRSRVSLIIDFCVCNQKIKRSVEPPRRAREPRRHPFHVIACFTRDASRTCARFIRILVCPCKQRRLRIVAVEEKRKRLDEGVCLV